jgi:hypothetical protein
MERVAQPQIKQAASVAAEIRRNFIPNLTSCRTAKLRFNVVAVLSVGGRMHLSQPVLCRQARGNYNEFPETGRNAAQRAALGQ